MPPNAGKGTKGKQLLCSSRHQNDKTEMGEGYLVRNPRYSATIKVTMLEKLSVVNQDKQNNRKHLRVGRNAHIVRAETSVKSGDALLFGHFCEAIYHALVWHSSIGRLLLLL